MPLPISIKRLSGHLHLLKKQKMINIDDYNYGLPESRIAKHPCSPRDNSKLLIYKNGLISEDRFSHIADYLPSNSLLVCNNTRVIHARLVFHKDSGSRIEIFCLEPILPSDYQQIFSSTTGCTWKCMIGNAKKCKSPYLGQEINLSATGKIRLIARIEGKVDNTYTVHFSWQSEPAETIYSFGEILELFGEIPIPPYLKRKSEATDTIDYQTVYSKISGSVAAPTAGLHFTDSVLASLAKSGIAVSELTLHVGAGTFQPVKVQDATQHLMHKETFEVTRQTITDILHHIGNITAVGTTSVRSLESLYFIGEYLENRSDEYVECFQIGQSQPYDLSHSLDNSKALENILTYMQKFDLAAIHAQTQIMIRPKYEFHYVDRMITNFHQPKSTLLLLVSAFVKGDWRQIYNFALAHDFRFLSYGDSSLLFSN